MGVHFPGSGNTTIVNGTLGQNTETVALTSNPINLPLDNAQILVHFYVLFGVPGGSSSMTGRLRRGTGLTGTVVNIPFAAGPLSSVRNLYSGCYVDTPGAVGGQQYSLTLTGAGMGATGTIDDGCIVCIVL